MDKHKINELLTTTTLVALGTTALVGIHHIYRKQHQPHAQLQDYVSGIHLKFKSLPTHQLARLQYAYQQASFAGQQAYYHYPNDDNTDNAIKGNNLATDFSAIHTTTMLAREVRWVSGVASMPQVAALGRDKENADSFGAVGIDGDRQIVWQTTMPERVHDIVVQPLVDSLDNNQHNKVIRRNVVVMGRRPSESFWVLDTASGQVQHAIKAESNRHFYGHACYSLDGELLYVTENDTVSLAGKIGIYEVNKSYQKVAEFDSYGIGPHELIIHPDGETLIIANGGIKTEQASREELNLDSMRPSLVYLNRHDGALLEQVTPEHNQMSIRHLAMHDNGTVMIGIQFQGEKHINVPLVLTHQRGDTNFRPLIMPDNLWQRFHQYIASVAVDSKRNLLCVTTPIGGCAAVYNLTTRKLISAVQLPDCAGASIFVSADKTSANDADYIANKYAKFIVSDGQGQLTALCATDKQDGTAECIFKDSYLHKMSFDNHLQAL